MNTYGLVICLLILIFAVSFLFGLPFLLIGLLQKNKRNGFSKVGAILSGFPIAVIVLFLFIHFFHELIATQPSKEELVGIYQLTETSGFMSTEEYSRNTLELKKDGSFYFTPNDFVDICEKGTYTLDYARTNAELSFRCPESVVSGAINRQVGGFRIDFTVDPDSHESFSFEKVK